MQFAFCSINGSLVAREQAVVPYDNIEYAYGFGVYENIRVSNGKVLHTRRHLDRLLLSAKAIGLEYLLTIDQLEQWITELTSKIAEPSFNLKLLLVGASDPANTQFIILPLAPHFPEKKWYRDGVHAVTVKYERWLPQAKTLNMLGSYLVYREAKKAGAYDALLIDNSGNIREGTRTNVFFTKGDTVIGVPEEEILPGVTRDLLLETFNKQGISYKEEHIPAGSLSEFDGAFFTSTSAKLMPIRSIDAHNFGSPTPFLQSLVAQFSEWAEQHE